MPAASALVTPAVAAPVLLVTDGILSAGFIPAAFRQAERRDAAIMAVGALAGVPTGSFILNHADALTVRWAIAALASSMLVLLMTGWRYRGQPTLGATVGVGAVAGLFGGLAQMSGPPVVAYWLSGRANAALMRASIILFFGATTLFTALSYLWNGLITAKTPILALLAGPSYALGLFIGARAFRVASESVFRKLCFGLIALSVITSLPLWR
jgi:uncharacterized membrane protein YfcA